MENQGQHTPGEWTINEWPQAGTDIAIGAIGTPLIAKVVLRDCSINEQRANAHLIAAAPELLEALRTAETLIALDIIRDDAGCLKRVRAAIAKAEGRR